MQKISFILLLSVAFLIGDALWAAEQLSSTAGTTVSSLASDTLSEIKELVDTHRIYPYEGSSIAPSGRYVAYTEWDPQVPSLFLMDMITGSRVQIASAIVPALSWSHDGRYLSFVFDGKGKNGLSIYDTSEHTIKAIPGIESHAPLVWSDDGALILVHMSKKNVVESSVSRAPSNPTVVFDSPANSSFSSSVFYTGAEEPDSLWAVADFRDGHILWTTDNVPVRQIRFIPQSHSIIYSTRLGNRNGNNHRQDFDIYVQSDGEHAPRKIGPRFESDHLGTLAVSPDGEFVSEVRDRVDGNNLTAGWSLINVHTGQTYGFTGVPADIRKYLWGWTADSRASCAFSKAEASVLCLEVSTRRIRSFNVPPQFALFSGSFAVSEEDYSTIIGSGHHEILLNAYESKTYRSVVLRIDTSEKNWHMDVLHQFSGRGTIVDGNADGNILYFQEDSNVPGDFWAADPAFQKTSRISNVAPELRSERLGVAALFPYTSLAGAALQGVIHYPVGYVPGRRYAAIECAYPGVDPRPDIHTFPAHTTCAPFNLQILLRQGYVVIQAQLQLSPGHAAERIRDSMLGALDEATRRGIIDNQRVGAIGCSYGGYLVMESLALGGPRYAAGVEISGMSDPVSFYLALGEDGSTFGPGPMEGNGHVAGPPWTDLENFISSSPVLHADHISAPLLIIQSSEDTAPMPDQAGEMFAALRMLHKRAEYVLYKGGDHCPSGPPGDRYDVAFRTVGWFNYYLKPGEHLP